MNEAMLKTVLVGGRTDMFRDRVPDGRSGNRECSLIKLGPCPWCCVIHAIRRMELAL